MHQRKETKYKRVNNKYDFRPRRVQTMAVTRALGMGAASLLRLMAVLLELRPFLRLQGQASRMLGFRANWTAIFLDPASFVEHQVQVQQVLWCP